MAGRRVRPEGGTGGWGRGEPVREWAGMRGEGEEGNPGVTVECVESGKNTSGEGGSLGRYGR